MNNLLYIAYKLKLKDMKTVNDFTNLKNTKINTMGKIELRTRIVDIVKDYAEGNYHLDITEKNLKLAAEEIVKLHIVGKQRELLIAYAKIENGGKLYDSDIVVIDKLLEGNL